MRPQRLARPDEIETLPSNTPPSARFWSHILLPEGVTGRFGIIGLDTQLIEDAPWGRRGDCQQRRLESAGQATTSNGFAAPLIRMAKPL
jgi:hypothetical protein